MQAEGRTLLALSVGGGTADIVKGKMSGSTINLGLSGRDLKNKDLLGKSDPYIIISRPIIGGGFTMILTSETKKVKFESHHSTFLLK